MANSDGEDFLVFDFASVKDEEAGLGEVFDVSFEIVVEYLVDGQENLEGSVELQRHDWGNKYNVLD